MRIGIDISPISTKSTSQHKVRGVGAYINLLKEHLPVEDKKNEYLFIEDKKIPKDIDLLHFPYFDPFFLTFPLIKKKKTVITIHDIIPLAHGKEFPAGIKGNLKWQINKRILLSADGIITDSKASRNALNKLLNYPNEKTYVVPLGVSSDFKKIKLSNFDIKTIKEKYSLPDRFLMYVGDVTWNKNLPRLIEAINLIHNIPLVMVGRAITEKEFDKSNSWNRDRNYLIKNTENKLFHKLGFVPTTDLIMLYNLADALVMPSLDEGFGLPALEAMSCGCPVIISHEGSLPEVGGEAALYVDAYSTENIKKTLEKVWTDSELRKRLSTKSIEQSRKFSIEKMIRDTVSAYEIINEKAH